MIGLLPIYAENIIENGTKLPVQGVIMETMKLVQSYTERGWNVFPCKIKDKTPLVKWQDEATNDIEKVKSWWTAYPNANVGLATGRRSMFWALDVDAGHGGVETLKRLISEHGSLPNTPVSKTGGGGFHYLFSYANGENVRNTASKIGKGIDTRGDGGYIVAPPSLHPSGKFYQWDDNHDPSKIDLSPAPAWLLELLERPQEAPGALEVDKTGAYSSGQRNSALTSLSGAMSSKGM